MTKKITSNIKKIAYLAPEIPAISATFVYNEILNLEKRGLEVFSFSIHYPIHIAEEPGLQKLLMKTFYLYDQPKTKFISAVLSQILRNFIPFTQAIYLLIHDILKIGIFSIDSIKLFYQFMAANVLAIELKNNRIQYLHIHFGHVPTQIGMYAAKLANVPFSFTTHANDIFQRGSLLKEKSDRSKKVITISEYNRDFLISKGVDPAKICIVRCGVDTTCDKVNIKPIIGIPVIGSLGRLVEKKGMDILIRACALLKEDGISFKLQIAGDGPLLELLKVLVKQLNICENVDFLGLLRHDKVFEWLNNLDCFTLASKRDKYGDADGIPVVLMEAMESGIPIISTTITGIPELIEHRKHGLLSLPDNEKLFAENIKLIFTDTQLREEMVQNAKKRVEEEFNIDVNTERIYKIIME